MGGIDAPGDDIRERRLRVARKATPSRQIRGGQIHLTNENQWSENCPTRDQRRNYAGLTQAFGPTADAINAVSCWSSMMQCYIIRLVGARAKWPQVRPRYGETGAGIRKMNGGCEPGALAPGFRSVIRESVDFLPNECGNIEVAG